MTSTAKGKFDPCLKHSGYNTMVCLPCEIEHLRQQLAEERNEAYAFLGTVAIRHDGSADMVRDWMRDRLGRSSHE